MSLKGIDVSDNQGIINWADVAADGVKFAILRSVRGSGKTDYQFLNNVNGCRVNGIPFDVYKYAYALNEEKSIIEAEQVVALLKSTEIKACTVWHDMEDKTLHALSKTQLNSIVNAFKEVVEDAGYNYGTYCNLDWYKNVLDVKSLECPFWIARYPSNEKMSISNNPNSKYMPAVKDGHELFGWQYSSKGTVSGINGNVDLNMIYMDIDRENSATTESYVGNNPYPVPTYTLYRGRLGMSKDYVKWLQWEAKDLGFPMDNHGGIDGSLGEYTEKVISALQVWLGLADDKKCGPKTIAALCSRY